MSLPKVGLGLLLVGSLALGYIGGEVFYKLFLSTMPPAALGSFSRSTAHMGFVGYGLLAGAVIFVWTILAVLLAPVFRGRGAKQAEPAKGSTPA